VDFELTDEQRLLRDTVRDFADREVRPVAEELDRTKSFPYEIVAKLGQLGLMGIPFPEEYGGGGADTLSYALAIEELARVDSSVCITVAAHTSLGTMPIHLWGTDEQKSEWLPVLCSGERLASFGLTEPEAGSDAGNIATTAVRDGDGWRLNGQKIWNTNGSVASVFTVAAKTDPEAGIRGITNFIVTSDADGFSVTKSVHKLGMRGSPTSELAFQDVWVPDDQVLGDVGRGFQQFMQVIDGARVNVAAMCVGLAQAALDESVTYAQVRRQFGSEIGRYQAIQALLADMATEVEAARHLVLAGARMRARGEDVRAHAAMAKRFASDLAVKATNWAVEIFGGYGYSQEYPVERLYRDAPVLILGEGSNEIQQLLIARRLLEQYQV
jgi:short-chain 2-methylacyl-CoA dehydrogenase